VAGAPDELERLWTPHRMGYVSGATTPEGGFDQPSGCPFCTAPTRSDEDGLIVARGDLVYAVLNLYPYNPGHLMVCPYRHVPDYTDLTEVETTEFSRFTQSAMTIIRSVSGPAGFNLGMNQGHVAGAGIAGHLHQHVVPRWGGDTNFMTVTGKTKTLPQLLADTRELLASAWADIAPNRPRRARRYAPTQAAPGASSDKTPAKAKPTRTRTSSSTVDNSASARSPRRRPAAS
jgi:ATP adenylyltransferase